MTAFGPMKQRCPMTLAVMIAPGEMVECEPMRELPLTLHVLVEGRVKKDVKSVSAFTWSQRGHK